jgi:glutamate-1-semialdehyde aminotransferase
LVSWISAKRDNIGCSDCLKTEIQSTNMVVDTTIAQPTMNPTNNVITSRELKKATVYEKLTQLAEEIQEGIRSISDSPKDDLDTEIEDLRENSYHQRYVYFYKYEEICIHHMHICM